ncbi:MAG: DUF2344 domain-containing protein [Lachnospiraceae bacterium]|nr:DUF2344 domain-containing protein [Lachnospiraceae bacterium]
MIRVRIRFEKKGPVRFIGHLDVMRYFQKVMRRAKIDIAYSEGYSPHQLMSFAMPLSVGATSDAEYADLTLRSFPGRTMDDPPREAPDLSLLIARLNDVMHEGITVTDACVLPEGAKKAMTAVCACGWRVSFRPDVLRNEDITLPAEGSLRQAFLAFLDRPSIPALKKTKAGEKQIDLRPFIYEADCSDDGVFTLLLKAGSEDNVKPSLLLGAFLGKNELPPAALVLHRTQIYQAHPERERVILPLIADPADASSLKMLPATV